MVPEEALSAYYQNRFDEAIPVLERSIQNGSRNPDTYAYLSAALLKKNKMEEAVLLARRALALAPCHSFSHEVLADAYNPQHHSLWGAANADSTWRHMMAAVGCDSADGNVWMDVVVEAWHRNDRPMEQRALRSLVWNRFLTPAILAYGRWSLRGLPENAVLITNGDMDTYPLLALQETESLRPDIAVVNISLLNLPWYTRFVCDRYGVPLPYGDQALDQLKAKWEDDSTVVWISEQIIQAWTKQIAAGAFDRPFAFAVTVRLTGVLRNIQHHLTLIGPANLYSATEASAIDTSAVRRSTLPLGPEQFVGSCVSGHDRSPARRGGSDRLLRNIAYCGLIYAWELLDAGRASEALAVAEWAETFERATAAGIVDGDEIESLKEEAMMRK